MVNILGACQSWIKSQPTRHYFRRLALFHCLPLLDFIYSNQLNSPKCTTHFFSCYLGSTCFAWICVLHLDTGSAVYKSFFFACRYLEFTAQFLTDFCRIVEQFLKDEPPSIIQWGGILLSVIGAIIYFLPLDIPTGQILGLIIAFIGVLANSGSSLLGRRVIIKVVYHLFLSRL